MKRLFAPDFPFAPKKWPFFYGWVVVFAGTIGILASIPGQTAGVGPFIEPLMAALDLNRVEISFCYLVGTFTSGLLLPHCGHLYDKYGVRPLIVITCICFGLSLLLMGSCDWIHQLSLKMVSAESGRIIAIVLLSISFFLIRFWGQGVITMISRNMTSKWFNRRRGFVSAISGSFISVTFASAPICLYYLVETFGWKGTLCSFGLLYVSALMLFCWLFFRDNPEECGLEMDGMPITEEAQSGSDEATFSEFKTYHEFTAKEALSTLQFWVFTGVLCIQGFTITAVMFHAISFSNQLGMGPDAFYKLMIPTICINVAFGFFLGWLSNQVRLKYILALFVMSQAVYFIALPMLNSWTGKALYILFGGISGACFGTLFNITWPRFYGRKFLGKIQGYVMSALVITSALGPLCFSVAQSLFASYHSAIYLSIGFTVALGFFVHKADNPQKQYAKT